MSTAKDSLFIRTLQGEVPPRPPVWFMRQAGRCLKSYRTLKEKYPFETLLATPELAAQVTLLPIDDLGVDAAIVFSDILVIAEAMGFTTRFSLKESSQTGNSQQHPLHNSTTAATAPIGPSVEPALMGGQLRTADHPYREEAPALQALGEAIAIIKRERPALPLIGFCGGPLTVFLYLFSGRGHPFDEALRFIEQEGEKFEEWMVHLTNCSLRYAQLQITQGVDAFQIFESWAGLLSHEQYQRRVLPHVIRLATGIREIERGKQREIPLIFFPRKFDLLAPGFPQDVFHAVGVDHETSLQAVRANLLSTPAQRPLILQGNIPPNIPLEYSEDELRRYLGEYLQFFDEFPHWIVNLGHGVHPQTPENSLRFIVETLKQRSE